MSLLAKTVRAAAFSSNKAATELLTDDGWKWRRLTLFSTLIFLGCSIGYMEWQGTDSALYSQAIVSEIASGTALVTAYVFGAIWDDKNKRMHAFGREALPEPAEPETPPDEQR